jgi:antirestriction protein
MTTTNDVPRVWVGCLACYNDGRLVGEWVDATEAAEFTPCERPDHEEWWCFDHEGLPITGECSPQEAGQWADAIAGCVAETGAPLAAVLAYADNFHADGPHVLDDFPEAWSGEWDTEADFAYDVAESCGYIPTGEDAANNPLLTHIDWDGWTRDLFMGDYWSARNPDGGVFVFRND